MKRDEDPFFIVGAPRSGTTLLRNILRQHPKLECPEETSFYRWVDPFGTRAYANRYEKNEVLAGHREIDGFTDEEFWEIYGTSESRRELQDLYMARFLEKKGNPDGRWFEKTPQHTAGLLQLLGDYPGAKVIHIFRSPLNVVASIRDGKIVGPQSVLGAANIWLEGVRAADLASARWPGQVLQIGYEELVVDPHAVVNRVLDFVCTSPFPTFPSEPNILPMNQRYVERLSPAEIQEVFRLCGGSLKPFGYPQEREAHEEFLLDQTRRANTRFPVTIKKKLAKLRRRLTRHNSS